MTVSRLKTGIFGLMAFFLLTGNAFAQGVVKFETDIHDFGEVMEGDLANYDFKYTNTGDKPFAFSSVQASCGCTTPNWDKDPVLPGKSGSITASYNSAGRPGPFTKTITITSNAKNPNLLLTIKGMVLRKGEEVKHTEEEIKKSPVLTLDKQTIHLGKIEKDKKNSVKVTLSNTGKSSLVLGEIQSVCNCTNYVMDKTLIATGEKTVIDLSYTPHSMGRVSETIYISSNDITKKVSKLVLTADVVESLATQSPLKESRTAVPFK